MLSLTSQGTEIYVDGAGRDAPPGATETELYHLARFAPGRGCLALTTLATEPSHGGMARVKQLCYPCLLLGQCLWGCLSGRLSGLPGTVALVPLSEFQQISKNERYIQISISD